MRLTVAPLRFGAGIKGKIITSLSHGVPCVASSVAAEGLPLTPDHDILVADTPAEFADAVVRLYTNREMWARLSSRGLDVVRRGTSFDAGVVTLAGVLGRLGVLSPAADDHRSLSHDARLEERAAGLIVLSSAEIFSAAERDGRPAVNGACWRAGVPAAG